MHLNNLTGKIVHACLQVHKTLGPGLFETVYCAALSIELNEAGLPFEREKSIHVFYKDQDLGVGFKSDFLIAGQVILEVKSVPKLNDIHRKQTLNYLKLTKLPAALLVNFNVPLIKDGIERILNIDSPL